MMIKTTQAVLLSTASFIILPSYANSTNQETNSPIQFDGYVTLTSKYISRGLTNAPENDDLAIQTGLNLSYNNFYVGYWGSTLGYSYAELQGDKRRKTDKLEHDFIVGYSFDTGRTNWNIWNATYFYPNASNTTSNEMGVTATHQFNDKISLSTSLSAYTYDVVYANQGDTYLNVIYTHQLNDKLSATASAAASYFNDNGKYEGLELGDTKREFAYRFSSIGLDYALTPELGLSGQYIFGGKNRYNEKQKNLGVVAFTYSF